MESFQTKEVHSIETMCLEMIFKYLLQLLVLWNILKLCHSKCDFFIKQQTLATSKMLHGLFFGTDWKQNPSLRCIRYTVGVFFFFFLYLYKPEQCFYHTFQTELHTNKWAMWFESSSVKWLRSLPPTPPPTPPPPSSPCASVGVQRINVTGQWETAASLVNV